jgi:hypothetical protein
LAVAFVVSIIVNGLAAAGVFGKGIGQISDENPTFVTPDGITFSVWGLIYTLLLIFVSAQFCPSESADALLSKQSPTTGLDVRQRLTIAFILNAVWLPVYVNEYFWVALLIIVLYLVALVSVYEDVNTIATQDFFEWLAYAAPISTNASWVTVATFANLFTSLGSAGWKDTQCDPEFSNGVAGSVPAAMAVGVLVTLIAIWSVVSKRSVMWSLVAGWALLGIYRMQTIEDPESFPVKCMNSALGYTALACGIVSLIAAVVSIILIFCAGKSSEALASDSTATD